jgi:hypothetical protein
MYRIGILSGEEPLGYAVIERINGRGLPGLNAEFCRLREARISEPSPYRVIIDRISHMVEYYSAYLKHASLSGTYVINNPFIFPADDKFHNYCLAYKLGIPTPRTACLPSREYGEDLEPGDTRNLELPPRWEEIADYIGFPAVLKPYDGYGWRDVRKVSSMEDLLAAYEESGEQVMVLQEYIEFEHYVRAFVIGKKKILPIRYDPDNEDRRYIVDHKHLTDELGASILDACSRLNEALGYDFNTVEFAIRDKVAYAIDFMNPMPATRPEVITEEYFKWVVENLSEVAIEYALGERPPEDLKHAVHDRPPDAGNTQQYPRFSQTRWNHIIGAPQ